MESSRADEGSVCELILLSALESHISAITAKAVLRFVASTVGVTVAELASIDRSVLVAQLQRALRLYVPEISQRDLADLVAAAERLGEGRSPRNSGMVVKAVPGRRAGPANGLPAPAPAAPPPLRLFAPVVVKVTEEADIVHARHAGRELCERLGFSRAQEIKTATVISELARNIVLYARAGEITVQEWRDGRDRGIEIVARDRGPGIPHLDVILAGHYKSKTGLGLGLLGTKRLAQRFEVTTTAGNGTEVVARMALR